MEYTQDPAFMVGRSFVERLVRSIRRWTDDWRWHQHNQGEQAPAVFLRSAAAACSTSVVDQGSVDRVGVDATFAFLESEFGTDRLVDSLIGDSFLAALPGLDLSGVDVSLRLGPNLRSELERQRTANQTPVTVEFVNQLAATHAAVAESLRENLVDWDYELIPYLFMGDLVRAVIGWLETVGGRESLASLLATFEDAYGHDDEVDNLIALGFVENLPFPHEKGAEMLSMLGPKLRAEYAILFSGHQIPSAPDPIT